VPRSAAVTAVQFAGVDPESKLSLVEFLLVSNDLQASARRAVDWLTAHTHVKQAVVAVLEPGASSMVLVAEHGVTASAIVDFSLTRDDAVHPLIQAMRSVAQWNISSWAAAVFGFRRSASAR